MITALRRLLSGQGDVDFFLFEPQRKLAVLELLRRLRDLFLDALARFVRKLADHRTLLGGKRAHLLEDRRERALFAQIFYAQLFKILRQIRFRKRFERFLADLFNLFSHVSFPFRSYFWGTKKSLVPAQGTKA